MLKSYFVIGAMAGSSMDGLDLVQVSFEKKIANDAWIYVIHAHKTIAYPTIFYTKLKQSPNEETKKQHLLDTQFGEWIGKQINDFTKDSNYKIDLLGVHGHTVIHQPDTGISWQLGDGATIATITNIPTVTDFRSLDIRLGGQGAPLVPVGDFALFSNFDACLNLGGIANISFKKNQTAGDICPCNQVLNYFAKKLNKSYDAGGELARKGQLNVPFMELLANMPFFRLPFPKSLANNFIAAKILDSVNPLDGLHSYVFFMVKQISILLSNSDVKNLLVTGGGTFNVFLMKLLKRELPDLEIVIPSSKIVNFKEAIIFAFLALKKHLGEVNVLASVTGARRDSISGVIHFPSK